MKVKRVERGWAGHFICGDRCLFRRNTMLICGRKRIIVSTVGAMRTNEKVETIGAGGRYYETMAFKAKFDDPYWEIDVQNEISFDAEWSIWATSFEKLPKDVDNKANDMHENVVGEIESKMVNGKL